MMPRTSVVMPFLDAQAYLLQAIESVQAQTDDEWELLLVDDGSTDAGPEVAAAAASTDPRIRLLPRPPGQRGGAAGARNLALREARGEFVCFLDADDLFLRAKLERQVAVLRQHPQAAMVLGPTYWWHPDQPALDWVEPVRLRGLLAPPYVLDQVILMLRADVPCINAVLVRRSAIEEVGGFEEQFRLYEDQTLWVKLMSAYPVYADYVVTARYRQHSASVSARAQDDGLYQRLGPHPAREPFLDWTRSYLQAHGLLASSTRQALRCAFARVGKERDALTAGDRVLLAHQAMERKLRWTAQRFGRVARRLQGSR